MINVIFLVVFLVFQDAQSPPTPVQLTTFSFPGSPSVLPSVWDSIFAAARSDPSIRKALFDLVAGADATMKVDRSWYQRPTRFEEIPVSQVDPIALVSGRNRDVRALAMNDCRQADFLRSKVLGLAVAARYSSDPGQLAKVISILEAVTEWQPFQRAGWSLGDASRTMPEGGDGVNMATAWGIHGVIDILEVLGDRAPDALRASLRQRLRAEIVAIVDSWTARRPWYVQSDAAMSNQWIDPSAALVRACLYLGDPSLADEYELGVRNVSKAIGMSASDGAFLEGITYAQMSFGPLFQAILAMKDAGDRRFDGHPFVGSAWKWFIHQMMPCGALVNCSDSHMSRLPEWAERVPLDGLAMAALASGSDEALQTVRALFPDVPASVAGFRLAMAKSLPCRVPDDVKPWAYFPSQQIVCWREALNSPTNHGMELGIWIKGGSTLCRSHAHRDQGQVSVYRGCNAMLLDCGTPDYSDPEYERRYAGVAGHGIMQLEPVEPFGQAVDAPITVRRIDSNGGLVEIDLAKTYEHISEYKRSVEWQRDRVTIVDRLTRSVPTPRQTEIFRFHVGCPDSVQISGAGNSRVVRFDDVSWRIQCSQEFQLTKVDWPDRVSQGQVHRVFSIVIAEPIVSVELTSEWSMSQTLP
jgi:hypothetical protein